MQQSNNMIVFEDNEAVIEIVLKKRSLALRHVARTHRVALDWTYEVFEADDIHLRYCNTQEQVADMLTKSFTRAEQGQSLCAMVLWFRCIRQPFRSRHLQSMQCVAFPYLGSIASVFSPRQLDPKTS